MKSHSRLTSPMPRHRLATGWKQPTAVALLLPLLFIVATMQWRWISKNKDSLFRVGGSWYVERLPCELCGQMGFVRPEADLRILKMCPLCQGRGGAYVRRLNEQDVICPACGGMGRIWDDPESAHFCERCGGRGLVHVEDLATNLPPAGAP